MSVALTEPTTDEWAAWDAGTARRLNIGAGNYPLRGFTNLDMQPLPGVDIIATVPPIPYPDASLDDIYLGHVLEHYDYDGGLALLRECWRVLTPGGRLGVVVPDMREVFTRWLRGDRDCLPLETGEWLPLADLDAVSAFFIYSVIQPSQHRWSYEPMTLARIMRRAGFTITGPIDGFRDPRIIWGHWYNCGHDAIKPVVSDGQ